MCGFAGVVRSDGGGAEVATVAAMAATMGDLGPDGSETWAQGPVALGHRRLKVIDLSEHACPAHGRPRPRPHHRLQRLHRQLPRAGGARPALLLHRRRHGEALQAQRSPRARPRWEPQRPLAEGARVTIFVDDLDHAYTGTVLPLLASGHRYGDAIDTQGVGWDHVEVRVDEPVADDVGLAALGINVGDFVAFDVHPVITPSGYVNSRHLDDKAGVAAVLGAFKALIDHDAVLPVSAHLLVTIAEEVGLGASSGLDADMAERLSVDEPDLDSRKSEGR